MLSTHILTEEFAQAADYAQEPPRESHLEVIGELATPVKCRPERVR